MGMVNHITHRISSLYGGARGYNGGLKNWNLVVLFFYSSSFRGRYFTFEPLNVRISYGWSYFRNWELVFVTVVIFLCSFAGI